jgi:cell wall-associated NlpC family hydrolase
MRKLCILLLAPLLSILIAVPASAATASPARYETKLEFAYHWALTQRGKPYVWGGTGPGGYDCSGLVYAAYKKVGITLPRTTFGMLDSRAIHWIPAREALKGDLAFYGSGHVEMAVVAGSQTYGAATAGTFLDYHRTWPDWKPTAYYRVTGALKEIPVGG